MSPRPRSSGRALLAVPVALLALTAATPAASARTTLELALPAQADAGVRIPFTYTTKGLPRRGKLVVLRRQGTAGAWKVVKTVKRTRKGAATLPAMDWGRTAYRLAVVRGRRTTKRSGSVTMAVFKPVTLGQLFGLSPATATTPTRTFSYVLAPRDYPGKNTAVTVDAADNTCRSIHVDWTTSTDADYSEPPTGHYALTLTQESADPVRSDAEYGTFAALDAGLVPGRSWSVQLSYPSNGVNTTFAAMDGTASCSGPIDLG